MQWCRALSHMSEAICQKRSWAKCLQGSRNVFQALACSGSLSNWLRIDPMLPRLGPNLRRQVHPACDSQVPGLHLEDQPLRRLEKVLNFCLSTNMPRTCGSPPGIFWGGSISMYIKLYIYMQKELWGMRIALQPPNYPNNTKLIGAGANHACWY